MAAATARRVGRRMRLNRGGGLCEGLEPRVLLSAVLQTAWGIGTTSAYGQQVSAITTDGAGNVYVLGSFAGTVDFDPSSAVINLTATGSFTYDLFLAKYSASGSLIWAKAMGSTGNDMGGGILLNGSGNVMITGYFSNTINMDPNGGTTNLVSAGGSDVFVAQYDTDGNLAWAKSFGGTGDDMGNRIVSDHQGGYIITGTYQNTADLDPGAGVHLATASTQFGVYVTRIDASGNLVWSDQFTAPDNLYFADVAVDAGGNVYAAGYFAGPCDLNPGPGTQIFGGANQYLCFAAKFGPNGNLSWARTFGQGHGGYGDACLVADMTLDTHNNIIIAGSFGGTVDFDPGRAVHALTEQQSPDAFTGYAMKLNSAGGYMWSGAIVGDSWSDAYAVTTDAAGNIYVAGEFNGTNTFDITGTSANDTLTSRGMDDAFLAKYSAAGQLGWVEQAGGSGYDHGLQVALGPGRI